VRWIDPDFKRLEPVAVDFSLKRKGVRIRRDETIEARKFWRRVRPQIGKQNPAALDHRIGFVPDIAE